ncbi:MAG: formate-nitrite transporter family protein [Acidobacteriota bacterium]|jgi:formate/nitrite transporter FocA (FNT family)|nr:formate-nitrite transporter family protein [Acidobacteriota bacterium]
MTLAKDVEKADRKADRQEGSQKSYREILAEEISSGQTELERPALGLLMSGLSAGLDVGWSLFLMGVMLTLVKDALPHPIVEMLVANMYAVGFIFVILGRSELFTEHTTLAVVPVLNGSASVGQLLRLWSLVYVSNIFGVSLFAGMTALLGPALGVISRPALGEIAHGLLAHGGWEIFASAILAGWLMGLLSWLVTASRDTISQVFFVWLVMTAIGFSHLHHVIAGSAEVLAGLFAGQGITWADFGRFLLLATLGNTLGGSFFVALLKFGHATQTSES